MTTNTPSRAEIKAARMLEQFATRRYASARTIQRMRIKLLLWVLRGKLETVLKRSLDVIVALIALFLTAPLMVLTALAVRLDSPGPVLFRQQRVGRGGALFSCYKFRSMYIDAEQRKQQLMSSNEADGPVFKMRHDPRITRVGRVIRKLSIDELPQLFNVLRGDMSLVGPRPAVPQEVARYEFDQLQRLDAIPGITGLQQVSGRSDLSFTRWVELDLEYIQKQSIWTDVVILLKTIPAVLLSKGAY